MNGARPRTRALVAALRVTPVSIAMLAGMPSLAVDGDDSCLVCHTDEALVTSADSIHGRLGLGCTDCHLDLAGVDDWPHADTLTPVDCGPCHDEPSSVWGESLHGHAHARGNPRAPGCADCHGDHAIRPAADPRSRVHDERIVETCGTCHGSAGLLTDVIVKLPQSVAGYARSVHGDGRNGTAAASCTDCHGAHDLFGAADARSRINPQNVSRTCGTCHVQARADYEASIHGRALAAGISDSPTCSDCHGEHLIRSPDDPESRTHVARLGAQTCGRCHNDPVIIAKYSLRSGVVDSYLDSYHGWATRGDSRDAASCVSCHNAHLVLPESHPDSPIHAANVTDTCRRCHAGASERFAASYTHESASITANPINRWIRTIYRVAIVVIVGAMALHNLVIMNYYVVARKRAEEAAGTIRRFDAIQIVQHLVLTVSFVVLAVTGFALRYPEAGWVRGLGALGMTEATRGELHRIAGVALVVASISHAIYLVSARGRRELRALRPSLQDLRDAAHAMRFYTWRSTRAPRYGRYDYAQKAEYWALIWGTALMILTGLVLWFPELIVRLFPSWIVPASQTIHYYEAWLATLAIVVWHFFFVIFHPEAYPMSWSWLTGRISIASAEAHHGEWYREELADGEERSD